MSANSQSLIADGVSHHRAGRLMEAEQCYRAVLRQDAENADAFHLLGVVAQQQGRTSDAVTLIEDAIARNDRVASFYNNYGNCLVALARHSDAILAYRKCIELEKTHYNAHFGLANALNAADDLEDALTFYSKAIRLQPANPAAIAGLADVLRQLGRTDEALAVISRAVSLDPRNAGQIVNRANILRAAGQVDAAIIEYRRAIALQPSLAEAHNNLGLILSDQHDFAAAAACYERALLVRTNYAESYVNLGDTLRLLGREADAVGSYSRAIALDPNLASARLGLAMTAIPVMPDTPDAAAAVPEAFAQALDTLSEWSSRDPSRLRAAAGRSQPFHLAYRPSDVTGLLGRYGDLISSNAPPLPKDPHRSARRRRLMIISAHVRDHPVWRMILRGWIARLDRARFELVLYHVGTATDAQTDWATERVDRFVGGSGSLNEWQKRIANDRPDVILYPEIGMDPTTAALSCQRLAPVQMASWGHPITTGLPTIDIFISADALEPPHADSHYRERLVRLPGIGVCPEPDPRSVDSWGPRRSAGKVRFALCQQPIKFDPTDVALIAQIARHSGDCEFWVVLPKRDEWTGALLLSQLRKAFVQEGLDPEKLLRTTPWMGQTEFGSFLASMDIYLDCPVFSGFTTALTAMQNGLPIVTLEGAFLRQRLAAGLLRQARLDDGIVGCRADYVAKAAGWADEARVEHIWGKRRKQLREAANDLIADIRPIEALQDVILTACDEEVS